MMQVTNHKKNDHSWELWSSIPILPIGDWCHRIWKLSVALTRSNRGGYFFALKIATTTAISAMTIVEKEIISVSAWKVVMESPPFGDNSNHPTQ